ncbi:hypothetical protein, partial [Bosea sp. (in: a-proteobacteria)]|uniref:hypothetical protein n=1 Tax=Bosea sp. (in: a-proteobacteria) TaxID=1871050 RepID=UPI004033B9CC
QQAGSKKRRKATLAVTVDPEVTEAVVNKVGDGLRDKSKKCYASQMKHFGVSGRGAGGQAGRRAGLH